MKYSRLPDASSLRSTLGRGCCWTSDPPSIARCAEWFPEALTLTRTTLAAGGSRGAGSALTQVAAGGGAKPEGRRSFRVRDDTGVQRLRSTLRSQRGSIVRLLARRGFTNRN